MKKLLLGVFVVLMAVSFTSCRETEKKAEDAVENATDAANDA